MSAPTQLRRLRTPRRGDRAAGRFGPPGQWSRSLWAVVLVACLVLSGLSMLFPWSVGSDAWCWLVWGREIRHLTLDTTAGATWKPLPVLLTVPVSLLGGAAPAVWLWLVRAAWVLAVALAYRLGARLAGRAAGAVAVLSMLTLPNPHTEWLNYFEQGRSEPLVAALVLGTIARHLAGRRTQAAALGALVCLGRPEAVPLLVVYALLAWRTEAPRRPALVALVAVVPALWLGGGLWGSGHLLGAVQHTQQVVRANAPPRPSPTAGRGTASPTAAPGRAASTPAPGTASPAPAPPAASSPPQARPSPLRILLRPLIGLLVLPLWLTALWALVSALLRARWRTDPTARVIAALGLGALAWMAIIESQLLLHLPVIARFMVGPGVVLSVLAGVGAVAVVRAVRQPPVRVALAVTVGAIVLGFSLPRLVKLPNRVGHVPADARGSLPVALERSRARLAIERCGGRAVVLNSDSSRAREAAWWLHVPIKAVGYLRPGAPAQLPRGLALVSIHGKGGKSGQQANPGRERKRRKGKAKRGRTAIPGPAAGWRELGAVDRWQVYAVHCPSASARRS